MTRRTAEKRNGSRLRLAADIGGTFTDIAVFDDRTGNLSFGKALSTPHRLVEGINAGVVKAGSSYKFAGLFLHGSTIAINTILERTGAKTALLVTEGFRDIYEIGRINRPDAYNLFFRKHEPLVERALRFEVKERVLSGLVLDRAVDGRPLSSGAGQAALRAHAGIGTGGGGHRYTGAVSGTGAEKCHRLRYGRHHGQSRRHSQGRSSHERCRPDRRLREGAASSDRDDGHFRGWHRRGLDRASGERRAAGWAAKRGRGAGPRLLWPRRQGTDGDRCQPRARPPCRRPVPRRRDAARYRGCRTRAHRARGKPARYGCDGGGRGNLAHRRDRDVLCGQRSHNRARSRCRRLRAGGLWRRRPH